MQLDKIIATIVAAIASVQKVKADLDACRKRETSQDAKINELEAHVADLEAALAVFMPSQM